MMRRGFTIVELLIVIVVIAILAAISIVTYQGMQERARLTVAQADLRSLWQAVDMFRVENDRYPAIPSVSTTAATELEQILVSAGLFEKTRGTDGPKFAFCGNTSSSDFVIAAAHVGEIRGVPPMASLGKKFWYINSSGLREGEVTGLRPSVAAPLTSDSMCGSIGSDFSRIRWSFSVPTPHTP